MTNDLTEILKKAKEKFLGISNMKLRLVACLCCIPTDKLNKTIKMRQILTLFVAVILVSCFNQTNNQTVLNESVSSVDSISKSYVDSLTELENSSTILNYDSLGNLMLEISFNVKTDNLNDYENGIMPFIRLDSPQLDIKKLIGKNEIVIPESNATIIIDYPLTNNFNFELISKSGFTRTQLINEISKQYYQLYEEEEKTATIKTVPMKERKMFNRNQTNGKYGIWGHDISDLVLNKIKVYKNSTGKVFLVLQLES